VPEQAVAVAVGHAVTNLLNPLDEHTPVVW
jgi:hypothetical protein